MNPNSTDKEIADLFNDIIYLPHLEEPAYSDFTIELDEQEEMLAELVST